MTLVKQGFFMGVVVRLLLMVGNFFMGILFSSLPIFFFTGVHSLVDSPIIFYIFVLVTILGTLYLVVRAWKKDKNKPLAFGLIISMFIALLGISMANAPRASTY